MSKIMISGRSACFALDIAQLLARQLGQLKTRQKFDCAMLAPSVQREATEISMLLPTIERKELLPTIERKDVDTTLKGKASGELARTITAYAQARQKAYDSAELRDELHEPVPSRSFPTGAAESSRSAYALHRSPLTARYVAQVTSEYLLHRMQMASTFIKPALLFMFSVSWATFSTGAESSP